MNGSIFLAMAVPAELPQRPAAALLRSANGRPARTELRPMTVHLDVSLDPSAADKLNLNVITDAGDELFVVPRHTTSFDIRPLPEATANTSFPRWVRVVWHAGDNEDVGRRAPQVAVGDYQVDVLSRIPESAFAYVADAPNRAMVLRLRVKNDGVLFAWAVQDTPRAGQPRIPLAYGMEGGDF